MLLNNYFYIRDISPEIVKKYGNMMEYRENRGL